MSRNQREGRYAFKVRSLFYRTKRIKMTHSRGLEAYMQAEWYE